MPIQVIIAAFLVAAAVPLLGWVVVSGRNTGGSASQNLLSGGYTDLRQVILRRSARERAVQPLVEGLADRARRFTPKGVEASLERRLTFAGRPAALPLERVLALKLVLGAVAIGLAAWWFLQAPSAGRLAGALLAVALGYSAPDIYLRNVATKRQGEIALQLPDTMDQMTVCVEAGLGFEAAMARSARSGHGVFADELVRTLQEMQIGQTRAQALRNLSARTDVAELRRFVTAVIQAEQYGVPIADVLRVQSAELRMKRRQTAEERAMKIPVKIIFPLVLCILPALIIVLIGPAMISIGRAFSS